MRIILSHVNKYTIQSENSVITYVIEYFFIKIKQIALDYKIIRNYSRNMIYSNDFRRPLMTLHNVWLGTCPNLLERGRHLSVTLYFIMILPAYVKKSLAFLII